jgi:uncharacterized delta-60 repeat protein
LNGGSNFALLRLSSGGILDATFGTNGKLTTNLSASNLSSISAMAVDSSDRILAVGTTFSFETSNDFATARYLPNGALDTSFNVNGIRIDDFGSQDGAKSVKVQANGKILLSGGTYNPSRFKNDSTIMRYESDGSLDASFGANGAKSFSFNDSSDALESIVIQSDGKILMAGRALIQLSNGPTSDLAVARILP